MDSGAAFGALAAMRLVCQPDMPDNTKYLTEGPHTTHTDRARKNNAYSTHLLAATHYPQHG